AGMRVEPVREARLDAGREIEEGQGPHGRIERRREPERVLRRLPLDAAERVAGGLGLECADGPAVDEEEVVGEAMPACHRELAYRDAPARVHVHVGAVLDDPSRGLEGGVDLFAGFFFGLRGYLRVDRMVGPEPTRASTLLDVRRLEKSTG